jgi:hypothetical protein
MQRITTHDLEALTARINEAAGYGPKPKYPTGYHIGGAYGGVRLEYPAQSNGIRLDACNTGYAPKRELYQAMQAYLAGLTANHNNQKA